MALIILVFILILLKFIIELIDRIVCQVHVQIIQVRFLGCLILLGSESRYTLLMNIYSERIHTVEQHVNSQIEF